MMSIWQTKLHARLHDPAEKALILMRKPGGHESGNVRHLREVIFGDSQVPRQLEALLKQADHWSSAADRPQFPRKSGESRYPSWTQTSFTKNPALVHPLSGDEYRIDEAGRLDDLEVAAIEDYANRQFQSLICRDADGQVDYQKTLLAFWRFGPEVIPENDNLKLGALWRLLPADTRTPDHTIWQHLDLASAFAGAGERPALLNIAFGPVQDFIAAGRSQSDLWAGSHFLSAIAWAGLKVLCEELGPDSVLFPQLRGIPIVDAWLAHEAGLGKANFDARNAEWLKKETDANPLFVAALPNKIMALVPESRVQELADKVAQAMRAFVMDQGRQALRKILQDVGEDPDDESFHCYSQLSAQLNEFPDVHWAAAPWSLIETASDKSMDTDRLRDLLIHFHGDEAGFLGSKSWEALSCNIELGDGWFYKPNPGTLYPALYDLADKMLAASKSVRIFSQSTHKGWRCSLAADVEWLTTNEAQLSISPGQRDNTIWTKLAKARPSWVKSGEHLGALAMLKRLWPTLFAEQVAVWLGSEGSRANRFVVSSHTMALATSLGRMPVLDDIPVWLKDRSVQPAALPGKLVKHLRSKSKATLEAAKRIPAYLDLARDDDDRDAMEAQVKSLLNDNIERYYGLILMDGDQMGAWLGGKKAQTYNSIWHPQIREAVRQRCAGNSPLEAYCQATRAVSPAYHTAISGALNDFSIGLARHLVEEAHTGKLLYAGGDDVLATVTVDELLPLMQALRAGYTGSNYTADRLKMGSGHALLGSRLLRLMGDKASASMGAVVAHQMAPLSAVLKALRAAEHRAKNAGGRDAFHVTVIKRSGGALHLTAKWTNPDGARPAELLEKLRCFLAEPGVSRRAVYHVTSYLHELPDNHPELLAALLEFQFERQSSKFICQHHDVSNLSKALSIQYAQDRQGLSDFLSIAEFLARESRAPQASSDDENGTEGVAA